MKKLYVLCSIIISIAGTAQSVGINANGNPANTSAMLDVSSTTKGFLPPRMTNAQKNAISTPAAGLIIYCTDCGPTGEMQYYNSVTWINFSGATGITLPNPPTSLVATAGNAQVSVAFTAPVFNGGIAITGYTVTSSPGGFTATGSSSPIVVTGLTNATAYTFTVVATNAVGNSAASAPSAAVRARTVPDAPTTIVATEGNAQASVAFSVPVSNGGSTITGYTVTSSPGGFTSTGSSSPLVITGLTNGTSYTFTVVATNTVGNSVASAPSAAVITFAATSVVFVSPGITKQFLNHNLGADTSLNPHTPVVGLQGAYIQWGCRGPNTTGDSRVDWQTAGNTANFAAAPTSGNANAAAIAGWSTTAAANGSWGNTKTTNDPCPTGYRVPTSAEWIAVNSNNTASRTGTFASSSTAYGSSLHYGPNVSTKRLTLPASGWRNFINTAELSHRGSVGYYWSSTENGPSAINMNFNSLSLNPSNLNNRTNGYSLRCIEE